MSRARFFLLLLAAVLVSMSAPWAQAAPLLGNLAPDADGLAEFGRLPRMLAALGGDTAVAPALLSAPSREAATDSKNQRRSNAGQHLTMPHPPYPRPVLLTLAASSGDTPLLFREPSFNAATLAMAVNHFVAVGEDATVKKLAALGEVGDFLEFPPAAKPLPDGRAAWLSISERIGWVCRILFTPKAREPLRPPMYGALLLPYKSMPLARWPLFPVAHSGRTYFVLSQGYSIGGHPESSLEYVAYCRKNGIFRTTRVPVPTREQALGDAAALRRSEAWKALRWPNSSPQESPKSTDTLIGAFIQAQAERIPATKSEAAARSPVPWAVTVREASLKESPQPREAAGRAPRCAALRRSTPPRRIGPAAGSSEALRWPLSPGYEIPARLDALGRACWEHTPVGGHRSPRK
jgi:hypothetical protein